MKDTKGEDSRSKQQRNENDNDDDEEEENDEDYQPEGDNAADDADDDMMDAAAAATPTPHLNSMQIKQVDEAFEALFGYKWGTSFHLPDNPVAWTEQERLLCRMLGPADAAAVLQSSGSGGSENINNKNRSNSKVRPFRKHQMYKIHRSTVGTKAKDTKAAAAKIVAAATTKASSTSASTTTTAGGGGGGVDNLLKKLAGPTKVSTVAKTSSDWDKFKEQTGLGEKLEEQAESNAAFLKRQDFLSRVDNRKFEIEKQERERIRAKRGK